MKLIITLTIFKAIVENKKAKLTWPSKQRKYQKYSGEKKDSGENYHTISALFSGNLETTQ